MYSRQCNYASLPPPSAPPFLTINMDITMARTCTKTQKQICYCIAYIVHLGTFNPLVTSDALGQVACPPQCKTFLEQPFSLWVRTLGLIQTLGYLLKLSPGPVLAYAFFQVLVRGPFMLFLLLFHYLLRRLALFDPLLSSYP